jgi:hypothetical protein
VFLIPLLAPAEPLPQRLSEPMRANWHAVKRTSFQTEWQAASYQTNLITGRVMVRTNKFVELGLGINVRRADGSFVAADPSFALTQTGAEANGAMHKIAVPGNITEGITVTQPNGELLTLKPLGVDFYDPVDGRSVLLDTISNATGWLVASNEIVFSNCFQNLNASIRIRNTTAGVESDLILHGRPPNPALYGLSADTRLEMLTEQVAGKTPIARPRLISREIDPARRSEMVEPDFTDSELVFTQMKMLPGRAFGIGLRTNNLSLSPLVVGKSFEVIQDRRVIIEAVDYRQGLPAFEALPTGTNQTGITNAALNRDFSNQVVSATRRIPEMVISDVSRNSAVQTAAIRDARDSGAGQLASAKDSTARPAFVLDYQLLTSGGSTAVDFVFHADTTYVVPSGYVPLAGVTVFEGGTVIKFAEGGYGLTVYGTVNCDTTNYLPAVFTSVNDDSVGEIIPGSTGNPVQVQSWGIFIETSGTHTFRNLRFKHLYRPIVVDDTSALTLRNVQIIDAYHGVDGGHALNAYNVLARDVTYFYFGNAVAFHGEQMTIRGGTRVGSLWYPNNSSAVILNSLLVGQAYPANNLGTYTPDSSTYESSSDSGIFTTSIGGANYLASNTHRNMGVTTIDAELLASLSELTTYPPQILDATIASDRTLTPVVPRDTDTPDRGYHYSAVDYVMQGSVVENANVKVLGGAVLAAANVTPPGYQWAGLWLAPGRLTSIGTPTKPNRFIRLNQVQESETPRIGTIVTTYTAGDFLPDLALRFTEVSTLAGFDGLLYAGDPFQNFELSHSTLVNGWMQVSIYGGGPLQTVGITNNLVRGVYFNFSGNAPANARFYNNLIQHGQFGVSGVDSTYWRIFDNIFDNTTLSENPDDNVGPNVAGYNAYVAVSPQFSFDATAIPLTSLTYVNGPLGRYYTSEAALQDQGSRSALDAELESFTTKADQAPDTGLADIGLHYFIGCPREVYEAAINAQSPDAWFKLNDNSLLNAKTGNQLLHNGNTTSPNWDTDVFGNANSAHIFLNANQGDRLTLDETPDPIGGGGSGGNGSAVGKGSITLLFRSLDGVSGGDRYLLSQGHSTTSRNGLEIFFANGGGLKLRMGNTTLANPILSTTEITANPRAWYYLALTWDEARSIEVNWYIGQVGNQLNSGTFDIAPDAVVGNNETIFIGNNSSLTAGFRNPGDGAVDQIAFWDRELSADEVAAQFDALPHGPSVYFDLTRWELMLPVDDTTGQLGGTDPRVVNSVQLRSDFQYVDPSDCQKKYFLRGLGGTMVFAAPHEGAVDGSGPRSELRGTNPDGSQDNWEPIGTHTLAATCHVDEAGDDPSKSGDHPSNDRKVIIGQIHEKAPYDTIPAIILSYNFPDPEKVRLTVKKYRDGHGGDAGEVNVTLATGVKPGDPNSLYARTRAHWRFGYTSRHGGKWGNDGCVYDRLRSHLGQHRNAALLQGRRLLSGPASRYRNSDVLKPDGYAVDVPKTSNER